LMASRLAVTSAIGIGQVLAWGSSYYLPAVLAGPVSTATDWPQGWVIGALSLGLLTSGLVSPRVGLLIQRFGGRPVLAASAVLLAIGHLMQAASPNLPVFMASWLVIGLGMGAGLYDPAFATLGRLYGKDARSAITQVTLFGGFASTVCWPLSAYLVEHVGWRGTSLAYAAINILIVLPLYLFGIPREGPLIASPPATASDQPRQAPRNRPALVLLGAGFTVASVIMTIIAVNVLALLQARGLTLAEAVWLGALIGPSQVGARVLESVLGRGRHPLWSLLASVLLVTIGLCMLRLGPPAIIGVGFVMYGAGSGIRSIARGTVPLALFGHEGYAVLLGWLAMPVLIATAISPSLGAFLVSHLGADQTLTILIGAAVLNVLLVLPLLPLAWRVRPPASAA
jgi:predicted MFS family arabinose efflux permease